MLQCSVRKSGFPLAADYFVLHSVQINCSCSACGGPSRTNQTLSVQNSRRTTPRGLIVTQALNNLGPKVASSAISWARTNFTYYILETSTAEVSYCLGDACRYLCDDIDNALCDQVGIILYIYIFMDHNIIDPLLIYGYAHPETLFYYVV